MRPFVAQDYVVRRRRAAAQARDAGLAGVLVAPGPDLAYFTGYAPTAILERLTMLVIPAQGDPTVVVPLLERGDLVAVTGDSLEVVAWKDGDDEYATVARFLRNGRWAVSDATWALHVLGLQRALPEASFAAFTEVLPMVRAVKDAEELSRLAAAGAAADAAFTDVLGLRFAGQRERDVADDLAQLLRAHGHEHVDFTLVCAGENGADPHHDAGDRVIVDGDMVVLDFGGLMHGYGSDTSRTVHVGAELTDEEQEVHDVVRAAQQAGFEAVRQGAACQDVDRAARAVIEEAGYGEFFIHRTGHGIGTTTHEPPYMVEGEEQLVEAGMCFSIEPGIYLPGRFGVRIEDIVVAFPPGHPDRALRLNDSPREVQVVG